METILLHPSYFGSIVHYAAFVQAGVVYYEVCDNFQKQSYRTRTKIATATGLLALNIPIVHAKNDSGHQLTREVKIENKFHWQRDHWRSLKVAYQSSPFFEFFEDNLHSLYHTAHEFLQDFNLACHTRILDCLQLEKEIHHTASYEKEPLQKDLRHLVKAKKEPQFDLTPYHQLFGDKHGFLPNLSILDLLFNEGPAALSYLEELELDI